VQRMFLDVCIIHLAWFFICLRRLLSAGGIKHQVVCSAHESMNLTES